MAREMTATEVEAQFFAVLDEVAAGAQVEITIDGRTVARLVPAHGPHALRGRFTGVAMTTGSEEDLFSTSQTWELC